MRVFSLCCTPFVAAAVIVGAGKHYVQVRNEISCLMSSN